MSAAALDLGVKIAELQRAIEDSAHASTFNMRPAIDKVLKTAYAAQVAAAKAVVDLDTRTAALEARGNAVT